MFNFLQIINKTIKSDLWGISGLAEWLWVPEEGVTGQSANLLR
jgi:hypothetical protein